MKLSPSLSLSHSLIDPKKGFSSSPSSQEGGRFREVKTHSPQKSTKKRQNKTQEGSTQPSQEKKRNTANNNNNNKATSDQIYKASGL